MTDVFAKLTAGPNSVKEHTLRNGDTFNARSGTRSQRNQIEKKFKDDDLVMDAVALCLWFLAANGDGSRAFGEGTQTFKEFVELLDYDVATEMAVLIRKQSQDDGDDELTLDERVEKQLKNSPQVKVPT